MEYAIGITETLFTVVAIEADTLEDAIVEAKRQYDDQEIELGYNELAGVDIEEYSMEL